MSICPNGHTNPDEGHTCSMCGAALPPSLPPPPPPIPETQKPSRPRRSRWAVLILAAVAVLILVGAGAANLATRDDTKGVAAAPSVSPSAALEDVPLTPSSSVAVSPVPKVRIPDVIGASLREARDQLQEAVNAAGSHAELTLQVEYEYSDKPKGTVISTGPAAGIRVDSGGTVRMTVAKPIPRVPDVVQLTVERATHELESLGFTVRTRQQASSLAKGTVIAQSIPPGTPLIPEEQAVVLTVAKPPPGWYVRVIGSGSALVTWGNIGTSSQRTVTLPFSVKVAAGGYFNVVTVVAQRQSGDSGSITCQIVHSGRVVKQATSSGPYAVCTASKSV